MSILKRSIRVRQNFKRRPNCALNRCVCVSGIERQVVKRVKIYFVRTITEHGRIKEEQIEHPCCEIQLQFTKYPFWSPGTFFLEGFKKCIWNICCCKKLLETKTKQNKRARLRMRTFSPFYAQFFLLLFDP